MNNIKAVIFDFNGVLFWDTHLQEQAWDDMAVKLRGKPFSEEEKHEKLHGVTNPDILAFLLGRTVTGKELADLVEMKESAYRQECLNRPEEFTLSPGATDLLNYLVQNNIPHTIATSSEAGNVKFFFEHLNLDNWFDFERAIYDQGQFPGKPAPDIYLLAAKTLNLLPQDCLVIEDAKSGLTSAFNAGIGNIVEIGPSGKQKILAELPGVTKTIERLDEIIPLLQQK